MSNFNDWSKFFLTETLFSLKDGEPTQVTFIDPAGKLGNSSGEASAKKILNELYGKKPVIFNSYTVVLNSPSFMQGTPHISHVETSVKARDFDEAVNLVKLLKFEVELEITSISKDIR